MVGVHHMQAHALTPRLVYALDDANAEKDLRPKFPFLTLLVSGGHTLLVHSQALCEHSILAATTDIAIGDAIDKMARQILPTDLFDGKTMMYGRLLEQYAFPNGANDHRYSAPISRGQEIKAKETEWGWALPVPLAETRTMQLSFSGLESTIKRIREGQELIEANQRTQMAREGMRVAFEHLASRVILALKDLRERCENLDTVVVSGGVASNLFLRTV